MNKFSTKFTEKFGDLKHLAMDKKAKSNALGNLKSLESQFGKATSTKVDEKTGDDLSPEAL